MAYGSNILKKEAAYYSLVNANITNGILHIGAGGSAIQVLDVSDLPVVTKKMQFTCISTDEYADSYTPDIQVIVYAKMTEGVTYSKAILYPVLVSPERYVCEFSMEEGSYEEMYVVLTSQKSIDLILWELCPEASDDNIEIIIDGVKQSLPRLLYDYNTFPFDFAQAETTIAVITCRLLQNTDLQGHFILSFTASRASTITIRFYDNEAEELFAPVYYDCRIGYNTIGIPHAYINRLAGVHSFTVTIQAAAGTCHIDTRKVLFTIDGGYLAKREIDVAMDVHDLSIRQLSQDNGPDQIWIVGIDAGEALVKYRSYKESSASVGWTSVGSLGQAIGAAIEFDGDWVLRHNEIQYTIETDESPWYFWIVPNGTLYACKGLPNEEHSNVITLATNLTGVVKACKGYSSIIYPEQDQGLIVTYIKNDGGVYYRSYAYDGVLQAKKWDAEQQLNVPANMYNFVNVHRLNDYRLGFELSGNAKNLWLITERTYVAQSIYPESFDISTIQSSTEYMPFFQIYPDDYTPPSINVIETSVSSYVDDSEIEPHTYYVLYAKLDQELFAYDAFIPDFEKLVYDNTSITSDMVTDVKWLHHDGITEITITLYTAPLSYLSTAHTTNKTTWKLYDGTFISAYTSVVNITWDLTNYITAAVNDNDAVFQITDTTTFAVQDLQYLTARNEVESFALLDITTLNVADINPLQATNGNTDAIFTISTVTNFNIYNAGDEPI